MAMARGVMKIQNDQIQALQNELATQDAIMTRVNEDFHMLTEDRETMGIRMTGLERRLRNTLRYAAQLEREVLRLRATNPVARTLNMDTSSEEDN